MNLRGLPTILLLMACTSPLFADDAPCGLRLWPRCWMRTSECPSLGGSPDDYCRKPAPRITDVPRSCGPDDYCRKAAPCLTDVPRCGGPDDYCKKSIPYLLCPPASPYLLYGGVEPCCKHR
jgi:hypothetical protein